MYILLNILYISDFKKIVLLIVLRSIYIRAIHVLGCRGLCYQVLMCCLVCSQQGVFFVISKFCKLFYVYIIRWSVLQNNSLLYLNYIKYLLLVLCILLA